MTEDLTREEMAAKIEELQEEQARLKAELEKARQPELTEEQKQAARIRLKYGI